MDPEICFLKSVLACHGGSESGDTGTKTSMWYIRSLNTYTYQPDLPTYSYRNQTNLSQVWADMSMYTTYIHSLVSVTTYERQD